MLVSQWQEIFDLTKIYGFRKKERILHRTTLILFEALRVKMKHLHSRNIKGDWRCPTFAWDLLFSISFLLSAHLCGIISERKIRWNDKYTGNQKMRTSPLNTHYYHYIMIEHFSRFYRMFNSISLFISRPYNCFLSHSEHTYTHSHSLTYVYEHTIN